MIIIKELSVKKKIFILGVFLLGLAALVFGLRAYQLSRRLNKQEISSDKFQKEILDIKNNYAKLQSDYKKLEQDFQAVSADRENLIVQAKGLLADRALARNLEGTVEKLKKDIELISQEKQAVLQEKSALKNQIQENRTIQQQLLQEKERLTKALDKSPIKKLEEDKASLQKENSRLSAELKLAKSEANTLKESEERLKESESHLKISEARLKEELKEQEERTDKLNRNYGEAVRKNKALEAKVMNTPRKFAEIARQNKVLIRQTSNTHYNMGVFYSRQKEYSRAIAEFEKALELTPDDAYSHFNLGYIYAEYVINRPKAIEHFRHYLTLVKKEDKDVDWVKKYILTWQTWEGKQPME